MFKTNSLDEPGSERKVLYIIVFCDPPSNVKVGIGWVMVKEVAHD